MINIFLEVNIIHFVNPKLIRFSKSISRERYQLQQNDYHELRSPKSQSQMLIDSKVRILNSIVNLELVQEAELHGSCRASRDAHFFLAYQGKKFSNEYLSYADI